MPKLAYHRRPTNNVMSVGMNYLSDLVVRPGIRKRLWPLCLYRGSMNPGRAHRYWNFALLMMAAEAETLADGIKLANNQAFAQLCGPVNPPTKVTLYGFFGRLWDNPDVTENVPGLTEYVKSLELGPCWLTPVPHETPALYCAPWRISTHPDHDPNAERPESGIRNLYYPFLAHDPEKIDDGKALVLLANQLVPNFLPDQVRADVCQDLIVGLLAGDVTTGNAQDFVIKYIRRVYQMHPTMYDQGKLALSFNQPVPGTTAYGDGELWSEVV